MKYTLLAALAFLASCMTSKETKLGFDVDAVVHRSSVDTNKGIQIQVFPIDLPISK